MNDRNPNEVPPKDDGAGAILVAAVFIFIIGVAVGDCSLSSKTSKQFCLDSIERQPRWTKAECDHSMHRLIIENGFLLCKCEK